MTLTELKYILAVAKTKHFGRAAELCFVSQPTLSVAVKKFEEAHKVIVFERGTTEISLTEVGQAIVNQAALILAEAEKIKDIAAQFQDPSAGAIRLGVIYTIAPYLLPQLVPAMIEQAPKMPLILQENFTHNLLEQLKRGELDCAIMAQPLPDDVNYVQWALYEEDFVLAVNKNHALAKQKIVKSGDLAQQTTLLLGAGHCFRDNVLQSCPEALPIKGDNLQSAQLSRFEGSSLETLRLMVASGLGVTVLPKSSVPEKPLKTDLLHYLDFAAPTPKRTIVLVWRKSFVRTQAIQKIRDAVLACKLNGTRRV